MVLDAPPTPPPCAGRYLHAFILFKTSLPCSKRKGKEKKKKKKRLKIKAEEGEYTVIVFLFLSFPDSVSSWRSAPQTLILSGFFSNARTGHWERGFSILGLWNPLWSVLGPQNSTGYPQGEVGGSSLPSICTKNWRPFQIQDDPWEHACLPKPLRFFWVKQELPILSYRLETAVQGGGVTCL